MNIDLLKDDLKFPLTYDGYTYIWDSESNMVAMFIEEPRDNAERVESLAVLNEFARRGFAVGEQGNAFSNDQNRATIYRNGKPFILIRGWGRLQYKDLPALRQQNITQFFLSALNQHFYL